MGNIEQLAAIKGFCLADLGGPREQTFYAVCLQTIPFARLITPLANDFEQKYPIGGLAHWRAITLLKIAFLQDCLRVTDADAARLAQRPLVREFAGLGPDDISPPEEIIRQFRQRLRQCRQASLLLRMNVQTLRAIGVVLKPPDPPPQCTMLGIETSPAMTDAAPSPLPPFVAVIGLHRSGSSCTAGILHKLGVHMGETLGGYEPTGGYEAVGLIRLCEMAYPFPGTDLRLPPQELRQLLSDYTVHTRQFAARLNRPVAGGKYPTLCAMGDALVEVCGPSLRIIHIDRPLESSIRSLQSRAKTDPAMTSITDEDVERVQRWLWSKKLNFLQAHPLLQISWDELLSDPHGQIARIAQYLEISPSVEQLHLAAAHVKTTLSRH